MRNFTGVSCLYSDFSDFDFTFLIVRRNGKALRISNAASESTQSDVISGLRQQRHKRYQYEDAELYKIDSEIAIGDREPLATLFQ